MLARSLPELLERWRNEELKARRRLNSDSDVPAVEVLLAATTLHELGYVGAENLMHYASNRGFTAEATAAWLSLGSSIITFNHFPRDGTPPSGVFTANLDYTHSSLRDALSPYEQAGFQLELNPPDRKGELRPVSEAGFKAFGFYGHFPLFHTELDHANTSSAALLERVSTPTIAVLHTIVSRALAAGSAPSTAAGVTDQAVSTKLSAAPTLMVLPASATLFTVYATRVIFAALSLVVILMLLVWRRKSYCLPGGDRYVVRPIRMSFSTWSSSPRPPGWRRIGAGPRWGAL